MERLRTALKTVFCPPPLPTVLLAAFGYGSVILVFALDVEAPALRYASFLASAFALIITVTGLPYLSRGFKKGRERVFGTFLVRKLRSTAVGEKYLTDIHFCNRTHFMWG